jgi:hypothetical protein
MKGWRVKGLGSKDWVEGLNVMVKGSGLWFTFALPGLGF